MNWRQHLSIGFTLSIIFTLTMWYLLDWYNFTFYIIMQILIISIVSPLIPDLDHELGKLHHCIMFFGFTMSFSGMIIWLINNNFVLNIGNGIHINLIIMGVLISGTSFFNASFSNHRGFWHSISMAIIYGVVVTFGLKLNYQLGVLAVFSFWTHLLCDTIPLKIR